MQKRSPTILAGVVLSLGVSTGVSLAQQTSIEGRMDSKGKYVYTNNIADNPEPPPKAVAPIPPPADVVSSPTPESKLQAAVAALSKRGQPDAGNSVLRTGSTPQEIGALVTTIALQNGVDPDLVAAVIRAESNYDQFAVSSKGARGLMQLIPATGQRFGVQNLFDARENIQGGVRYLRFLLEKFDGNIELSLAAYNAGEGAVERLGRIPPIDETRAYVTKIRSVYTKKSAMLIPLPMITGPVGTSGASSGATEAAPVVAAKPADSAVAAKPAGGSPSPETPAPKAVAQPVQAAAVPVVAPPERIYGQVNARGVSRFSNDGRLD